MTHENENGAIAVAEPVNSGADAVASAVESLASHLHPKVSWDLGDHPMPTGREEVWRFTPVRKLKALLEARGEKGDVDLVERTPAGGTSVVIDPVRARELSVEPPADRSSAIAVAQSDEARLIRVPADVELDEPLELDVRGTGVGRLAYQQLIIEVGTNARAQIVFRFEGSAALAEKIDIRIGDGARVDVIMVQDWAPDTLHAAQVSLLVGRDAHVRTVQASLGGAVTRVLERASYAAPGGELEQYGLYFVDGGRHVEHRMFIDHNQPRTRSNVDYRGAIQGEGSHSVWVGDVLIRKIAHEIETYEANKNLLLSRGARADSIPNLEIETGNIVGAGHSSTTGRFDDEQLFYLESRGIPNDEARRLVVHGFFVDIVRHIGVPEVEERLMKAVERELDSIAPDWGTDQ